MLKFDKHFTSCQIVPPLEKCLQTLGRFVDPYQLAYGARGEAPPPTMVVELLIPRLLAAGEEEGGAPSAFLLDCLRAAVEDLAGSNTRREPLLTKLLRPHVRYSVCMWRWRYWWWLWLWWWLWWWMSD